MIGKHQAENLKTALATIEVLRKAGELKIERSRLYAGLKEAVQPGRFEVIREENPVVVIDGAHNDAGAKAIAETMKAVFPDQKILIVFGMVEKKETEKVAGHFLEVTGDFIITQPTYEGRAMGAEELARIISETAEKQGRAFNLISCETKAADSVSKAAQIWDKYDVVLFTGSLYLIGEIRSILKSNSYDPDRTLKYGDNR